MRTTRQTHKARAKTQEARAQRRAARRDVADEVRGLLKVARLAQVLVVEVGNLASHEMSSAMHKAWDQCDDALKELPPGLLK